MDSREYLSLAAISPAQASHIRLDGENRCATCDDRTCLHVCPAGVFAWDESGERPLVCWQRCLECGACELVCPRGIIKFSYPRGGHGVINKC
jgi:ferredoxin like protein